MAESPPSKWPERRRGLLLLVVLIGGMTLLSFASGRPGDFEAGMFGAVVGASIMALVAGVELLGRFLLRKRRTGPDQQPSSE
jgi:hypothetical protein